MLSLSTILILIFIGFCMGALGGALFLIPIIRSATEAFRNPTKLEWISICSGAIILSFSVAPLSAGMSNAYIYMFYNKPEITNCGDYDAKPR